MRVLCAVMVALAPLAAAAEPSGAPVVVVPASDPRIQYIGRFDVSNLDAPRCAWPGSIIQSDGRQRETHLEIPEAPRP